MTTRNEVLSWLESNIGKSVEFNNGDDVQCMDLVNYMTQKFFSKAMFVGIDYAKQIWDLTYPDGWGKIPAAQAAKPGDVFVMSGEQAGNDYGHTGIIAEDGVLVYDENYAGRKYVSKHELKGGYLGFIRPPYKNDDKGEIDMYLVETVDNGNWYIVGATGARHVKTERVLTFYTTKLNLPQDKMTQAEFNAEFGDVPT